jgi:hypothetical protein
MGLISRAEAEVAPKTIQACGAKSHGPDQPSAGLRQGLCCNAMGLISLSLKAVGPLFLLLSPQLPCCTPAACAAAPTRPELAPERGYVRLRLRQVRSRRHNRGGAWAERMAQAKRSNGREQWRGSACKLLKLAW